MRLRFSGFGGQGIILCGYIFGKAAMLDGRRSIQTQSYGSASRGGLTKSDVAIEDGEIHDLALDELDVLVAMSQQSYEAYRGDLLENGSLFFESDLVHPEDGCHAHSHGIQATDIAFKSFGRKIIANMVMMGLVNQVAELVSTDALRSAIQDVIPAGTEETNFAALEEGMRLGREALMSDGR